jgi:hypothetical protein
MAGQHRNLPDGRFTVLGPSERETQAGKDIRFALRTSVGHLWQECYGNDPSFGR